MVLVMSETRRICSGCGSVIYDNDNGCCTFCGDFMLDGNSPEEDDYDD
jgi:rRNA maturation endonuclease Nob1